MRLVHYFLKLSAQQLFLHLFAPVFAAAVLYGLDFTLTAFITFQLFIEAFVLWHLSIGVKLHTTSKGFYFFLFNLCFGAVYRFGTNTWQIIHYIDYGKFIELEKILWVIPIHLYASIGVVYCFYQNATWIMEVEQKNKLISTHSRIQTFFRILIFPWGLWSVQPRLNTLVRNQ